MPLNIAILLFLLICLGLFVIVTVTFAEKRHISIIEALSGILKPRDGSDD